MRGLGIGNGLHISSANNDYINKKEEKEKKPNAHSYLWVPGCWNTGIFRPLAKIMHRSVGVMCKTLL